MKHAMTGKRKQFEYAGICMEKIVKSLWVNLFLAGLSHLEPLCTMVAVAAMFAAATNATAAAVAASSLGHAVNSGG